MTKADAVHFTRRSAAQWRILHGLHWSERRMVAGKDCRALLREQGASSDDLMALSEAGLVEGLTLGAVVDLAIVNWAVALRARDYVACRITPAGRRVVMLPLSMLLAATGRGRRFTIADIAKASGVGSTATSDHGYQVADEQLAGILRAAQEFGLIRAANDAGHAQDLAGWTRIPATLRLSLTRKGGTYIARGRH